MGENRPKGGQALAILPGLISLLLPGGINPVTGEPEETSVIAFLDP